LFSPISVLDKAWSDNPYLYNLTPSHKMQAKAFINYYQENHKDEVLVLLRDGGKFDKTFGAALKQELEKSKLKYKVVAFSPYQDWKNMIGEEKAVILHTSVSKTNMTYTVNSLLTKSKQVTLMAPDKWMDFTSVDYKFWDRLNIHFITTELGAAGNKHKEIAVDEYRRMFNGDPSEFTLMGYDQMLFGGEVLHAFGKYFPLFVTDKRFDYSNSSFNLKKIDNCFHNEYIQVISFKDGVLAPASED